MLTWMCQYNDNTIIKQIDQSRDPVEVSSEVLDRKQIKTFSLLIGDVPFFTLHVDEGQRLIFRRRVEQQQGSETRRICYLVGWQMTVEGRNIQSIAYVFEDGSIHMAGKFRENHPWFYPIKPVPSEIAQGIVWY